MTILMVAPVALSVLLALAAARLGRCLPPATSVRLLSAAAIMTALSTGFVLSTAAFVATAQLQPVATVGRWSARALAAGQPVPLLLGLLCAVSTLALIGAAARRIVRAGRDLYAAAAICRRLVGTGTADLVIVQDDAADAYAIPGLHGRVVISTAMLRALSAAERRVLLAHEASHLRHHHHLYLQVAELSAAANPLLRPLARAVHQAVERWADEDAATATGDRVLAARAVARASLARYAKPSTHYPAGVLHMADGHALVRTRALLSPPPAPRRVLTVAVATLMLAASAGAVAVGHHTEHLFEVAHDAYSRST